MDSPSYGFHLRLKALRKRADLTMAEMARAAGLRTASSWQRYESPAYRKDYLEPKLVRRLAEFLPGRGQPPLTAEEVLAFGRSRLVAPPEGGDGAATTIEAVHLPEDLGPYDRSDTIPVYGAARGGADQEMYLDDRPIDWAPRPPFLRNVRQAYSMQVVGESMRPMFRAGQLVYVNPFRVARPEMGVVIYKKNGAVLVKEFVRRTARRLVIKEYQPREREFEVALDDIKEIHTVVGAREP